MLLINLTLALLAVGDKTGTFFAEKKYEKQIKQLSVNEFQVARLLLFYHFFSGVIGPLALLFRQKSGFLRSRYLPT